MVSVLSRLPDRAPISPKCTVNKRGETVRAVSAEYHDRW